MLRIELHAQLGHHRERAVAHRLELQASGFQAQVGAPAGAGEARGALESARAGGRAEAAREPRLGAGELHVEHDVFDRMRQLLVAQHPVAQAQHAGDARFAQAAREAGVAAERARRRDDARRPLRERREVELAQRHRAGQRAAALLQQRLAAEARAAGEQQSPVERDAGAVGAQRRARAAQRDDERFARRERRQRHRAGAGARLDARVALGGLVGLDAQGEAPVRLQARGQPGAEPRKRDVAAVDRDAGQAPRPDDRGAAAAQRGGVAPEAERLDAQLAVLALPRQPDRAIAVPRRLRGGRRDIHSPALAAPAVGHGKGARAVEPERRVRRARVERDAVRRPRARERGVEADAGDVLPACLAECEPHAVARLRESPPVRLQHERAHRHPVPRGIAQSQRALDLRVRAACAHAEAAAARAGGGGDGVGEVGDDQRGVERDLLADAAVERERVRAAGEPQPVHLPAPVRQRRHAPGDARGVVVDGALECAFDGERERRAECAVQRGGAAHGAAQRRGPAGGTEVRGPRLHRPAPPGAGVEMAAGVQPPRLALQREGADVDAPGRPRRGGADCVGAQRLGLQPRRERGAQRGEGALERQLGLVQRGKTGLFRAQQQRFAAARRQRERERARQRIDPALDVERITAAAAGAEHEARQVPAGADVGVVRGAPAQATRGSERQLRAQVDVARQRGRELAHARVQALQLDAAAARLATERDVLQREQCLGAAAHAQGGERAVRDAQLQRQHHRRQRERARIARGRPDVDVQRGDRELFEAQHVGEQAARRKRPRDVAQFHRESGVAPRDAFEACLQQVALAVRDHEPGFHERQRARQQRRAARGGPEPQREHDRRGDAPQQHAQQRALDAARAHSGGPMLMCSLKPEFSPSRTGTARSSRICPTGDSQRSPSPALW